MCRLVIEESEKSSQLSSRVNEAESERIVHVLATGEWVSQTISGFCPRATVDHAHLKFKTLFANTIKPFSRQWTSEATNNRCKRGEGRKYKGNR